jgi:L-rhamnose mutarotase
MKRLGQVIRLKPQAYETYKRLHADAWPQVRAAIRKANIRSFTIYHWEGLLCAHFEYAGRDFEADMAELAADPITQEWWQHTDPLQEPVQGTSSGSVEGDWWTQMETLFHQD